MASQTTTSSFPLHLDSQPRKDEASDSLSALIAQIQADRGHLRNVTEDALREEIRKQEDSKQDEEPDSLEDDASQKPKDLESRQKELFEARQQMLANVSAAHEQALLMLDSISFLIKDKAPRQAEQTMSPALKQMFPQGSLSYNMLPAAKPSEAEIKNDNLVTTGWTLQGLNKTADTLLESASKLEDEVRKETRYWDDVLSVRDKGWSICRVPRQKNALAVRYGFSEASVNFKNRSMSVMRAGENGNIVLDSGVARDPKAVRVQVFRGETLLADCRQSSHKPESDDLSARIHRARDTLFEEELFFELEREARILLGYGVKVLDHAVHIPLSLEASSESTPSGSATYVILSLESLTFSSLSLNTDPAAAQQAEAISVALRILLTHTYRKRFRERSKPPAPLSLEKRPAEMSNILRTLLNYIQHRNACATVSQVLQATKAVLERSGLDTGLSSTMHDLRATLEGITATDRAVSLLSGPWETKLTLSLPKGVQVAVEITTALEAPTCGSKYLITANSKDPAMLRIPDSFFATAKDALAQVNRNVRIALLQHIRGTSPAWGIACEVSDDTSEMIRDKDRRRLTRLAIGLGLEGKTLTLLASARSSEEPLSYIWNADTDGKNTFDDFVKQADDVS